jgi:hypothetical protein
MIIKNSPGGTPSAAWPDLVEELDRWRDTGRSATMWWRDDDAVTTTPRLADLLSLADGIPLALAVIPASAEPALAAALAARPDIAVLQHGWRHANHGGDGKKCEFPERRRPRDTAIELTAGRARLAALFGPQARPVLVPPWNRFPAAFLPLLAPAGLVALSQMAPRQVRGLPVPVPRVDVHVDVVAWHAGGGFIGDGAALGGLVAHLRARRLGTADPEVPTGILTHHLVMDQATGEFLRRLAALVGTHDAARWVGAAEIFPNAPAQARALPA